MLLEKIPFIGRLFNSPQKQLENARKGNHPAPYDHTTGAVPAKNKDIPWDLIDQKIVGQETPSKGK